MKTSEHAWGIQSTPFLLEIRNNYHLPQGLHLKCSRPAMHIIHIIVGLISLQSFSYVQSDSEQHGPNDKKIVCLYRMQFTSRHRIWTV